MKDEWTAQNCRSARLSRSGFGLMPVGVPRALRWRDYRISIAVLVSAEADSPKPGMRNSKVAARATAKLRWLGADQGPQVSVRARHECKRTLASVQRDVDVEDGLSVFPRDPRGHHSKGEGRGGRRERDAKRPPLVEHLGDCSSVDGHEYRASPPALRSPRCDNDQLSGRHRVISHRVEHHSRASRDRQAIASQSAHATLLRAARSTATCPGQLRSARSADLAHSMRRLGRSRERRNMQTVCVLTGIEIEHAARVQNCRDPRSLICVRHRPCVAAPERAMRYQRTAP